MILVLTWCSDGTEGNGRVLPIALKVRPNDDDSIFVVLFMVDDFHLGGLRDDGQTNKPLEGRKKKTTISDLINQYNNRFAFGQ